MTGLRCQCDFCRNAQRMLLDAKQISESLKADYTSGQVHVLRRLDLDALEATLERCVSEELEEVTRYGTLMLTHAGIDGEIWVHAFCDQRVRHRAQLRSCRRNLVAIRALRKELGL